MMLLTYRSAKRIEKDRALQFCETHNILYFETSAKNGQSVNELFQNSCDELLRRIEKSMFSTKYTND